MNSLCPFAPLDFFAWNFNAPAEFVALMIKVHLTQSMFKWKQQALYIEPTLPLCSFGFLCVKLYESNSRHKMNSLCSFAPLDFFAWNFDAPAEFVALMIKVHLTQSMPKWKQQALYIETTLPLCSFRFLCVKLWCTRRICSTNDQSSSDTINA